jgi:hypothetical protein
MLASLLLSAALALSAPLVSAVPQEKRQQAQVVYSCTQPNTAALTFVRDFPSSWYARNGIANFLCFQDDGPWIYAYDIINTLNDNGAKGTFFFSECFV